MEQPLNPSSSLSSSQQQQSKDKDSAINNGNKKGSSSKQKIKLPTPQELITHYESQGMDTQEASIKVIDDLQHILFRVVTSGKGKKDKLLAEASRKLDTVNARLGILEMKLDSKPSYPQSFAIGVASAASYHGVAAVWPQIAAAAAQVWNSVSRSTKA